MPIIGPNIGIHRRRGGGWSPESIASKLLYWGSISEISGGEMPNKITGATDYITVAGSAGSYTFQIPNTAPYIAADTDYIWFKTDASQRTTTEAELVGYDLQRTPVKYLDDAPNSIQEIVIFKLGETLTASERNSLFAYMHLPVMWDNSLNPYGYVKSNRGATQQLWTPESILPATLSDTSKTVGWYLADDLTTITKDGSNIVSSWNDKNATGKDFTAGTALWVTPNIIRFDGTAQYLLTGSVTVNQPLFLYMVFKQLSWTQLDRPFYGGLLNEARMTQYEFTPEIGIYAGTAALTSNQATINQWVIVRALFNGANSKLIIDNNAAITGNTGTQGITKIGIGSQYGVSNAHMEVKEVVVRNTTDDETDIYNYLKNKYSL